MRSSTFVPSTASNIESSTFPSKEEINGDASGGVSNIIQELCRGGCTCIGQCQNNCHCNTRTNECTENCSCNLNCIYRKHRSMPLNETITINAALDVNTSLDHSSTDLENKNYTFIKCNPEDPEDDTRNNSSMYLTPHLIRMSSINFNTNSQRKFYK